MFNDWLKNFDPLDYNVVKKNITSFNEKIINFWKDFSNDVFKNIKRED